MTGLVMIAAFLPVGLVAWIIWFLKHPPASSPSQAIPLHKPEQLKVKSVMATIGTFCIGILIIGLAKALFHKEPSAKQLTVEEQKEIEVTREWQRRYKAHNEEMAKLPPSQRAGGGITTTTGKRKYPRALDGGGLDWSGVEGGAK